MKGRVENGALVILEPRTNYNKGDIVLVRINGKVFLHLVKTKRGDRFLIGNNTGGMNDWVDKDSIYGLAVEIKN